MAQQAMCVRPPAPSTLFRFSARPSVLPCTAQMALESSQGWESPLEDYWDRGRKKRGWGHLEISAR